MQKSVEKFLRKKPGYLKKSVHVIADRLGIDVIEENLESIRNAMDNVKEENKENVIRINPVVLSKIEEKELAMASRFNSKSRVLVVGDIHEPFSKEGYLEFCLATYKKHNCNKVVFIGDVIDNHFSSFHPTDPDGFGAGEELERAIDGMVKWIQAFPKATVIIGNHDRLVYRKAFAGGVSKKWIREYKDVLNAPNWDFAERIEIDDVVYVHGEAGTARTKAKDTGKSRVQGHLHSQAYVEWINNRVFAAQVGTGINDTAYAFSYAKDGKESILSCLVVIEGENAYLEKMK